MKKTDIKKFRSVENFKANIDKTQGLINGLLSNISATEAMIELLVLKPKRKLSDKNKKMLNLLLLSQKDKDSIYILGFIALFSNFEFFMFDFLKELFTKFPKSMPDEKIVRIKEISNLSSVKKIKEYFIDSMAIEKSYDTQKWSSFIEAQYEIKFFKTVKDFEMISLMNELRNAYMHSGGITNSKFRTNVMKILKSDVPINEEISLDMKKQFLNLYGFFNHLLKNL